MTLLRRLSLRRRALVLFAAATTLVGTACSDNDPTKPPTLDVVTVTVPTTTIVMGQTTTATAAGEDQKGDPFTLSSIEWATSSASVATVSGTGVITGVAAGTATITATSGGKSGSQTITVTPPAAIKVNEVESNGGTPGDWVELYNSTSAAVDISGWVVKDNDDTHTYTIPAGTSIPAGGYFMAEEAAMGYGLGSADAARVYNQYGVLVDSYTWTAHASTTYGRCPDGTGAFATTSASTKGTANTCTPTGPVAATWPGLDDVETVDAASFFGENMSGLMYETASGANPNVLWAVKNGPGTLYRLIWNGTIWTPDATNSWTAGKALRYTDGNGNPDSEGVTYASGGSAGGIYVSTERNNDASTVSRNSILRFDPTQAGATLTATNDWNITSDLPTVGANLGIEGITWIPDSYLTSKGFFDEAAGHTYNPAEYPNHGTGLFVVGVEGNGMLYVYALNHVTNGYTRVATIAAVYSTGVMDLSFDRDLGYLWATCDDTCGNKASTLEINASGRFVVTRVFNRPTTLPNSNNEGFTIAPESSCVSNQKQVFWSDDSQINGNAIRRGWMACGALP